MGLFEPDLPAHAKHPRTGFPLCWKSDQQGLFEVVHDEGEVTCERCLLYMEGGPWTIYTNNPIDRTLVYSSLESVGSLLSEPQELSGSASKLFMERSIDVSPATADIVEEHLFTLGILQRTPTTS